MKKYLLGIDVGTTGTKTLLFTEDGEPVAHAYRPYPLSTPRVFESEQEPSDWWRAIVETVMEVTESVGCQGAVAAISLSTQGGTLVPVDERGEPLRPAIVWNDNRYADEGRELYFKEVGDADSLYHKTGWRLGRGLPLLSIRYLKEKEPEIFSRTDKFLSTASYVAYKMTGKAEVDISNAGIEQLVDIRKFKYDEKLLAFAGITEGQLAKPVKSGTVIGHLTKDAAAELGLSENTLLVAGAHDQYAVSLGAGSVSAGDILIGSGTCWVVTASGDREDFDSGFAQSVAAVPGLWGTLRSLSSGGVCLEWLRKNIAIGDGCDPIGYEKINSEVCDLKAAEDGLFFYPFKGIYGSGAFNKGAFVGMDLSHNKYHLAKAVMEGVVFQILWMMEKFKTKPSIDGLKLSGGASKSEVWTQILADVSGLSVRVPRLADLACVGAAVLAGLGAGMYSDCKEGYERFKVPETVIEPNPEKSAKYKLLFEKYKKQAEALGNSYLP